MDARSTGYLKLASTYLYGRGFWIFPTRGESAIEGTYVNFAETGSRFWSRNVAGHSESSGFGLQGVGEHRYLVYRSFANGAR